MFENSCLQGTKVPGEMKHHVSITTFHQPTDSKGLVTMGIGNSDDVFCCCRDRATEYAGTEEQPQIMGSGLTSLLTAVVVKWQ